MGASRLCPIGIPIAGPARSRFLEDREPTGLSPKSKSGMLFQPASECVIVSPLETLLELPVQMKFIVLLLVQPDEHIPRWFGHSSLPLLLGVSPAIPQYRGV